MFAECRAQNEERCQNRKQLAWFWVSGLPYDQLHARLKKQQKKIYKTAVKPISWTVHLIFNLSKSQILLSYNLSQSSHFHTLVKCMEVYGKVYGQLLNKPLKNKAWLLKTNCYLRAKFLKSLNVAVELTSFNVIHRRRQKHLFFWRRIFNVVWSLGCMSHLLLLLLDTTLDLAASFSSVCKNKMKLL